MKLDGVQVIDLSQFLPGPHLTMMMADHGAEGNLHIGNPIKFHHEPARIDTRLPGLGEDTEVVLRELKSHPRTAQ